VTQWTASDGTKINFNVYNKNGQGEVLVLLPGLLGTVASQWQRFVRPLSSDFRIVTLDLRGHGRSENNASTLTIDHLLRDIVGLLDFLQIETYHIAGYDLGGYLGLLMALSQS
jgi:pimeloyl-ACP methyl ester carboxylesterase